MADNKSSLVQIHQDVLDVATQSLKVSVVSDTSGGGGGSSSSSSTADILGVGVSGTRNNQVEVSFNTAPGATLITEAFSGGGAVSIVNGHSIYRTGTATTASASVVTLQTVNYRPAHEIYAFFTAAFATAGVVNSVQRIGLFDANNGFYVGYEGETFGISKRTATVNTFTARASFNTDLLDGNIASKFTRNGVAEAINLTFSNLFRIRFAWLGSGSVLFEVFSPDGAWVTFHTLRIPNSQYDPSLTTPNLPLSLQLTKTTAGATNLSIATACWAGGTTSDYVKISDTLTANTLASLSRSVITGETTAGGGGFVNVKVNPSGALVTEVNGTVLVQNGVDYLNRIRLVYSTTNVTTGAWVQLLASVGATAIKEIEIFDSSGETLELGVGAAASEVSKSYVFPGGNSRIPMQIPANARLAIRAVSATANVGEIVINLYG